MVPGVEGIETSFQGGVALQQRPLVPSPRQSERWFHVEHNPVQPSASPGSAVFDQLVCVRIQNLDGERGRQVCVGSNSGPIEPCCRSQLGIRCPSGFDAQRLRQLPRCPTDRSTQGLAMPDKSLIGTGAERAAPPQKERRFEYRGLAGPIGAVDQVDARPKPQLCNLDTAEVFNPKLRQGHFTNAWA